MRTLKQIDEMLSAIEKHLTTLLQKTNNNEIEILANCMLMITDLLKELYRIGE